MHAQTHNETEYNIYTTIQRVDDNLLFLQFLNGIEGFRVAGGRKYLVKLELQCLTLTQGPIYSGGTLQIQEQVYMYVSLRSM